MHSGTESSVALRAGGPTTLPLAGDFLQHSLSAAGGIRAFNAVVKRFGVSAEDFTPEVTIQPGQVLTLSDNAGSTTPVDPILRETRALDVYKSWIGVADADYPPGSPSLTHWPCPERPWNGRPISRETDLTPGEWVDVELAAKAYIFGNSRLVQSYRPAIEACCGPFRTFIYPIRRLTVMPGARLVVTGEPAILLVEDVIIHESGQIAFYAVARVEIGALRKIAPPPGEWH
jgi:hypothetical protein